MFDNVKISPQYETVLREQALAHLDARRASGTEWFTRDEHFIADGEEIRFMDRQRGIYRPKGWNGALSISTAFTTSGKDRPYDDQAFSSENLGVYKGRGGDWDGADNDALRESLKRKFPMVWFQG